MQLHGEQDVAGCRVGCGWTGREIGIGSLDRERDETGIGSRMQLGWEQDEMGWGQDAAG